MWHSARAGQLSRSDRSATIPPTGYVTVRLVAAAGGGDRAAEGATEDAPRPLPLPKQPANITGNTMSRGKRFTALCDARPHRKVPVALPADLVPARPRVATTPDSTSAAGGGMLDALGEGSIPFAGAEI